MILQRLAQASNTDPSNKLVARLEYETARSDTLLNDDHG